MKILIIGGAGMIGRKLSERLARDGELGGKAISSLTLHDVVELLRAVERAREEVPATFAVHQQCEIHGIVITETAAS